MKNGMEIEEMQGAPPHVAAEFFLWLWYRSEVARGHVDLDDGGVDFWVDDRISFRAIGEDRVSAVLTGENPSTTPEARAALSGGKVLRDIKLALRRGDREYTVTLRGQRIEVSAAKLPGLVKAGEEAEILYERMFLYEELHYVLGGLFRAFAQERTSPEWRDQGLADLRRWAATRPSAVQTDPAFE